MLAITPAVSIIMPVYNAAPFIADALRSVQAQSFQNWELILIDDGSTDTSLNIAHEILGRDHRVKMMSIPHAGNPSAPRNAGLNVAQGRYIAFLDADDMWAPEKLAHQIAFMDEKDIAISQTAYRCISVDGKTMGRLYHPAPFVDQTYHLQRRNLGMNAMIDRDKTGPFKFDEKAPVEDFDLFLRLLKNHNVHGLDEELYLYRRGHQSVSSGRLRSIFNVVRASTYARRHIGTARAAVSFIKFGAGMLGRRAARLTRLQP